LVGLVNLVSRISSFPFPAIAGIMAGGMVHIVMAGNPTQPSGRFFDAFHRGRGRWNCITIDAFDSPNLIKLAWLERAREPARRNPIEDTGGRLIAGLVLGVVARRRAQLAGLDVAGARTVPRPSGKRPQNGLTLEKLLQLDSADGGPLDDDPIPYLVTKRWVYEQ
jgi:hypothetical protein